MNPMIIPGVGAIMGLLNQNQADRRQLRMNKELIAQQTKAAKEMGQFNQGLALDTWEKTNFAAQRKQLEKAGLNVGLMYGQAGAGGTTQGGSSQMPSSSTAPTGGGEIGMGMQLGLQAQMMQAQIKNLEANTNKTNVEATKTAGVDTAKTQSEIEQTIQNTKNAALEGIYKRYQNKIADVEARIKDNTEIDAMKAIQLANEQTIEQIRNLRSEANVKNETQEEVINQINTASKEQALRIEAQKLGLIKATADINQVNATIRKIVQEVNVMTQENMREWDKMNFTQKELLIKQKLQEATQQATDFNTSTAEQIKQWTSLISSIIGMGVGGKAPIGFKY